MGLGAYVAKKLILLIPEVIGVSALVFVLAHLAPGGPILANLGPTPTEEQVALLKANLGLDKPIYVQFFIWFSKILQGDLGRSFIGGGAERTGNIGTGTGQLVSAEIVQRLPITFELIAFALLISLLIAIPTGILSAVKKDRPFDQVMRVVSLTGVSMPGFWLGILLILAFSVQLGWFPTGGYVAFFDNPIANLWRFTLPAVALGITIMAITARVLRSSMLEVLGEDYVVTARAKGLAERIVILRHALKNAMLPTVTIVGLQFGFLLSGTILIEEVFYLPGLGTLLLQAVFNRDYPVIQGVVLFIAFLFISVNLIVDVIYAFLDPRVRYEGQKTR